MSESRLDGVAGVPLAGFLDYLRQRGFVVGLDHYARLLALLEHLDADVSPTRLKTLLAPLFATTANEQELFYRAFDSYFPLFAANGTRSDETEAADASANAPGIPTEPQSQRRNRRALIVGLATVAVVAATLIAHEARAPRDLATLPPAERISDSSARSVVPVNTTAPTPTPAPSPVAAASPAPATRAPSDTARTPQSNNFNRLHGQLAPPVTVSTSWLARNALPVAVVFALSTFAAFVRGEVRAFARRRLLLDRQRRAKPPFTWPVRVVEEQGPYHRGDDLQSTARQLRARETADTVVLDVPQTVEATIAAQGRPTFRYTPLTRAPEYLALIERASRHDHHAQLFGELCDELESEGVHISKFYYDADPRVCRSADGTSVAISALRQKYHEHRLLLFGSGDGLTEPISGRLAPWVPLLLTWRDRALFTTAPTGRWSAREISLAGHFVLMPASVNALATIVNSFGESRMTAPSGFRAAMDAIPDLDPNGLVGRLEQYLGSAMTQLVCACALYPELQWDLTLSLASLAELGPSVVNEENLLKLIRLPWFRDGLIPDQARRVLLDALQRSIEVAARRRIVELLESSPPPTGSVAADRYELDLVVQRAALNSSGQRGLTKRTAGRAVVEDVAVLRLADERGKARASLVLPARLQKIFFGGHTGWVVASASAWRRGGLVLSAALVAAALVGFAISYSSGRRIGAAVESAATTVGVAADSASSMIPQSPDTNPARSPQALDELRALDGLREQLDTLSRYAHSPTRLLAPRGAAELYPSIRVAYFAAFDRLMFADTRSTMLAELRSLPALVRPADEYAKTYALLKAYLITTAHPEKAGDQSLVPALMALWLGDRVLDNARSQIGRRQFETYARELGYSNPFLDAPDAAVVEHARSFLRMFAGSERIYQFLLAEAAKTNPPIRLDRRAIGSGQYFVDPYEVPGAFTRAGSLYMLNAFRSANRFSGGETWVMGTDEVNVDAARLLAELTSRYTNDYIDHWRRYLAAASAVRFTGIQDATWKLGVLSGSASPLLQLFALASQNMGVGLPEIDRVFQPLQLIATTSTSDRLINDRAAPYINALTALQQSVERVLQAQIGDNNALRNAALADAATARAVVRSIASSFAADNPYQIGRLVQNLMEAPIDNVESVLKSFGAVDINGKARAFCAQARVTLGKFPFSSSATEQATIAEVNTLLRPVTGSLWRFHEDALAGIVERRANVFSPTQNGSMRIDPDFVMLLNRAAAWTAVLYSDNAVDPHLSFTIAPRVGAASDVRIALDGESARARAGGNSETVRIVWPGREHSASLTANVGNQVITVGPYAGPWAVFQLFNASDTWDTSFGPPLTLQIMNRGYVVGWDLQKRSATSLPGSPADTRALVEIGGPSLSLQVLRKAFFMGAGCPDSLVEEIRR